MVMLLKLYAVFGRKPLWSAESKEGRVCGCSLSGSEESRPALPLTGRMGRDYQQRSPLISYANMARQCQSRKGSMVGCRAKSWCVLWNIFKINWTQT